MSRRTRQPVVGVVLLAVSTLLAALTLAGCGRDLPPSALVGVETIAPADRAAMPPLAGTTIDGDQLDLADLRGRVVVVNAWASWCEPCRAEVPAFAELDRTVDPADVAVVGLNVSDDLPSARDFAQEFDMAYPSIVDDDGALLATIPGIPPKAIPSTVILDRDGRIATRIIGGTTTAQLASLVADVVAEGPGSGASGPAA